MIFHGQVWSSGIIRDSDDIPLTIRIVMHWISSFVAKPHGKLGRTGAVCPYVPPALKISTLWLTVVDRDYLSEEEMCQTVTEYLTVYHGLEPRGGEGKQFKTLVVIFPKITHERALSLVAGAQRIMKPTIVGEGLMLGEFFEGNDSRGLYNPDFHPLRSPIPLFVYRQLVPNDLVFLTKPSDPPEHRIQFLLSYLNLLADRLPPELATEAQTALAVARSEINSPP